MDYRIYRLKAAIEAEPERTWTVASMAEFVNLSPPHLHRLFKAETGGTPARFVTELRLGIARRLLERTFLTVKEIRQMTRFDDQSHFAREFKRQFGSTPTDFRKEHWSQIQASELDRNESNRSH